MKLLLLTLIITLNITFSHSNDLHRWLQDVSGFEEEALLEEEASLNLLSEIRADPFLNDIFDFGFANVIASGISRGRIPNTTFQAVSVSDWYITDEPENDSQRYTFTAVAVSDDGNSVVDMTFNVHYDVVTHDLTPGAYISKTTTTIVTTTPTTPQAPVTPDTTVIIETPETPEVPQNEEALIGEINEEEVTLVVNLLPEIRADPFVNEIFDFGVTNVIASGINRGRIPNTTFRPVSVSDWNRKQDSYGEWSTFSAVAVSTDGSSVVEMTFTVYYDYSTREKTLNSYSSKTTTTTITTTSPDEGLNEEDVFIGESELAL